MRKLAVLVLTILALCAVTCVLAEEGQIAPLYATVGDAMEDCITAGGEVGNYYAVVTQKDGKYYRSVANYDEKLTRLEEASNNLDYEAEDFFEKLEAAMKEADEYRKTLPIAYSEEFTAQPLSDDEMASGLGKTLSQLTEEGFEIGDNGTEAGEGDETIIVYTLRYGVYDYNCVMDADYDQYSAAQENGTEGDLVVKDMAFAGVTRWGFEKRFHTDGTVDEPEDLLAEIGEISAEIGQLIEKAQAGEAVDMEAFLDTLKAKYPDYAYLFDMYITLYQTYGAEGLAAMMTSAD